MTSDTSAVGFAILAPVPEEHLDAGLPVANDSGFVAYGSQKWELFRKVDTLREGEPVPVLIYPSHEETLGKLSFVIAWTGSYIGHVSSVGGAHPDGMEHRSISTLKYTPDNSGFWGIFWHVTDLRLLEKADRQPISSLLSYKAGKYWKAGSPPRGPEIVARPRWI